MRYRPTDPSWESKRQPAKDVPGAWRRWVLCSVLHAVGFAAQTEGPLETWNVRPLPWLDSPDLHDVAFIPGKFLAVGTRALFRSSDGIHWQALSGHDTSHSLNRVIEDLHGFLAVGGPEPVVLHFSADLASSDVYRLPGSGSLRGVARNGSVRVAVGDRGLITRSTTTTQTSLVWSAQPDAAIGAADLAGVAFGAGVFVAVGEGRRIWTSPDGTRWTLRFQGGNGSFPDVSYSGGEFLVIGDTGDLWRSGDGLDWTSSGTAGVDARRILRIGDQARWVIAGRPTAVSTNLETWTHPAAAGRYRLEGIAWSNPADPGSPGVLVGAGLAGAVLTSRDGGVTWEAQRLVVESPDMANLTHGNGTFATDSAWSADGVVWQPRDRLLTSLSFHDGRFTAFASTETRQKELAVSENGIQFTGLGSGPGPALTRPVYGNGRYVYLSASPVGIHGNWPASVVSTNGTRWTTTDIVTDGQSIVGGPYLSLAFGRGRFVAAGTDRPLILSSNGVSWWAPDPNLRPLFQRLEFVDGRFVGSYAPSVGSSVLSVSTNGESWTSIDGLTSPSWFPVRQIAGEFVTFNTAFELLVSTNRTDWVRRQVLSAGTYVQAAFGDSSVVVQAADGRMLQASFGMPSPTVTIPFLRLLTDGSTRLFVQSPPGSSLRVETSDDLREWRPWQTVPTSDGLSRLEDFDATAARSRFYRASMAQPQTPDVELAAAPATR